MTVEYKDHLDKLKSGCCLLLFLLLLSGCSSWEKAFQKNLTTTFNDEFVGFILLDPQSGEVLVEHQSKLHFTPASNTKLLTFYVADKILGDSIPTFNYQQLGDTLWLEGTGDPTLLHPEFDQSKVLEFLQSKTIKLIPQSTPLPLFGSGWAWDDFTGGYQRHRSWLPLYGNAVRIIQDSLSSTKTVHPSYFTPAVKDADSTKLFIREAEANIFYPPANADTINIPYRWDWELAALLLQEASGSKVEIVPASTDRGSQLFYQHHKDSLFKPLLQDSDNFIAEQLILLCAQKLNTRADTTISWLIDSLLADLPDRPIWVDGSGLSRYNMITPRSLADLLLKMNNEIPTDRLLALLPSGGVNGTLENVYQASTPYIFAKTGTLRHNHNLSGYLRTNSNKLLIFSFMHNHFTTGSVPVKVKMEELLRQIRDHY